MSFFYLIQKSAKMGLVDLPFDILHVLLGPDFVEKRDLKTLRLVHRSLSDFITPKLFKTIVGRLLDESSMFLGAIRPNGKRATSPSNCCPSHLERIRNFPRKLVIESRRLKVDDPERFIDTEELYYFVEYFPLIRAIKATVHIYGQPFVAARVIKAVCDATWSGRGVKKEIHVTGTNCGTWDNNAARCLLKTIPNIHNVDALYLPNEFLPVHVKLEQVKNMRIVFIMNQQTLRHLSVSTDWISLDEMFRTTRRHTTIFLRSLKIMGTGRPHMYNEAAHRLRGLEELDISEGAAPSDDFWGSFQREEIQLRVLKTKFVSEACIDYLTTLESLTRLDLRFVRFSSWQHENRNLGYLGQLFWLEVIPKIQDKLEHLSVLPEKNKFMRDHHGTVEFDELEKWDFSAPIDRIDIDVKLVYFPVLRSMKMIMVEQEEREGNFHRLMSKLCSDNAPRLKDLRVDIIHMVDNFSDQRLDKMMEYFQVDRAGEGALVNKDLTLTIDCCPWSLEKSSRPRVVAYPKLEGGWSSSLPKTLAKTAGGGWFGR